MKSHKISLVVLAVAAICGQVTFGREVGLKDAVTSKSLAAAQADPQPCTREQLTIKEGETDAAMGGVRGTPYVFTNVSKIPCKLEGYVSLELLNKAGALVKRATRQKSDDPINPVILVPGKTAWFTLNFNAGGAGHMGKPCPTYPQIRITTPGAKRPFILQSEIQTCAKTDFAVTPIIAGTPE